MIKPSWFLVIIFTFLIIPSASALGVAPGTVKLNFEPNINTSFEMSVVNYPPKNQDVEIYISFVKLAEEVKEDFSKTFSLEKTVLSIKEQEVKKSLNVFVNFPEKITYSGIHEIRIGAMPATSEEGSIVVRAGNEIVVLVTVPPEFATNKESKIDELNILNMTVNDTKKGRDAKIEIAVQSKSDKVLNNIRAEIKVLQKGKEMDKLSTNQITLNPDEVGTLITSFDTSKAEEGIVNLGIEVFFSSKSKTIEKSFNVYAPKNKNFTIFLIIIIIFLLIIILIIIILIYLLRKRKDSQQEA